MIKDRRNYYRILQVQPDAPQKVIQASYRAMMRELGRHPDMGGSTEDAFALNEAYETLKDPTKRAAYDDELFQRFIGLFGEDARARMSPILCPVCKRALTRKPDPGEICQTCRTPLRSEMEIEADDGNRRSISRTKSSVFIDYYSEWPGFPKQGQMIDFSPKGLRFVCDEKLPLQTVLKISSRLFEASGVVTNLSEEIIPWDRNYAIGVYFLAVRFDDSRGTFLSTSV